MNIKLALANHKNQLIDKSRLSDETKILRYANFEFVKVEEKSSDK